jgi:hypothetical protein
MAGEIMRDTTTAARSAQGLIAERPVAATVAMSMAGVFVLLLSVLHVVRADLEPGWHMISEYAVGPSGWMMSAAFLALASSLFALLLALWPRLHGWLGGAGLVFLALAALGLTLGGLFATDPQGTPRDQASTSGVLHGVSFMLGVPGILFAVALINLRLFRDVSSRQARFMLVFTASLVWLTMVVFAVAMVTCIRAGATGAEFVVGWQNRAMVFTWAAWSAALAWRVRAEARVGE